MKKFNHFILSCCLLISGGLSAHISFANNANDEYKFERKLTYELISINKKGKAEVNTLIMYADGANGSFAMEMTDKSNVTVFIYDGSKGKFVTLITDKKGSKSGTIMSEKAFTAVMSMAGSAAGSTDEVKVEKTGKSKTIAGLNCEQYLSESKSEEGEYWVAEGEASAMDGMMKLLVKAIPSLQANKDKMPDGVTAELISTSKKDGRVSKMMLQSYEKGTFVQSIADFQITDLSSFFGN